MLEAQDRLIAVVNRLNGVGYPGQRPSGVSLWEHFDRGD